jgi:hypothetical protein
VPGIPVLLAALSFLRFSAKWLADWQTASCLVCKYLRLRPSFRLKFNMTML